MRLPKISQKVSLRISQGSWEGLYSTYVEGIEQKAMTVAHPMHGGAVVPLQVGEAVLVEFIDGGERLLFSTRVLGYYTQVVPILSLAVPTPGSILRHQQRDFVRLDANLPLRYAFMAAETSDEGAEEATEKVYLPGRTMDISGSGAQIVVQEIQPIGTRLELVLNLQGIDVHLETEVVRLPQYPTPRAIWLGVRFVRVDERDRERIVRYIFSEQRSRRQKGLL